MRRLELLSPARDEAAARAAILNGADAVYIGAPAFGARKAAANSLEEIARVVGLAHRFHARVYATLNTLLHDRELEEARRLALALHDAGVDALIVQDMAFLQLDLPLALHASTQLHNHDIDRVKFLDRVGFRRVVLARELTLEEVRAVRREVSAGLECFVHGSLCVSMSGQCYLSAYLSGRSANRGECAQPCRLRWSLADAAGEVIAREKHLLSLRDLNLSGRLPALIEAGVDAFKIEGRLKDAAHVANVTRYYSALLDAYVAGHEGFARASAGVVTAAFTPDPERGFNRGFTTYFSSGRVPGMASLDTPKSTGKRVARVTGARGNRLAVEPLEEIHAGDGLCYLDAGESRGIQVNGVEGNLLLCNERATPPPGTWLYRNHDSAFERLLARQESTREVRVEVEVSAVDGRLHLDATDEEGVTASLHAAERLEPATSEALPGRICRQVGKCGGTGFRCTRVTYSGEPLFAPDAVVNGYRRRLLEILAGNRERAREVIAPRPPLPGARFPGNADRLLNVTNALAARFYREHGVDEPPPAPDASGDYRGLPLMTWRYCVLFELGRCTRQGNAPRFPLYLYNSLGRFRLEIDCATCFTRLVAP